MSRTQPNLPHRSGLALQKFTKTRAKEGIKKLLRWALFRDSGTTYSVLMLYLVLNTTVASMFTFWLPVRDVSLCWLSLLGEGIIIILQFLDRVTTGSCVLHFLFTLPEDDY